MTRRLLLASSCLLLVLTASAGAQNPCPVGDDGFDSPCCQQALPAAVPAFPQLTVPADWAMIVGCFPNTTAATVQLSAPSWVLCDYAVINVFAVLANGDVISGVLAAKYARTWLDLGPPGQAQVWRFLVNGDLTCQNATPAGPCSTLLPRCKFQPPQPGNFPVHFDGHVDYACSPQPGVGYTVSMSLSHLQGCISHASWSCASIPGNPPLYAHPDASYHLVAPAPFTFGTGVEPQGPLFGDAVRSSQLVLVPSFSYQCRFEAKVGPIGLGVLTTQQDGGCLCAGISPCTGTAIACFGTGCYQHQNLLGAAMCPPGFAPFSPQAFPGTPIAPTGFFALKLGSWSPQNQYPWSGSLTTYFGAMNYGDVCQAAAFNIHAVVGVAVSNVPGSTYPVTGTNTFQTFMDLQNVLPLTGPFLSPGYGCLAAADVVWNLNL